MTEGPGTVNSYRVEGMACGHCANFVTAEVERIPGVTAVSVDVDAGTVTVTGEGSFGLAEVRAAVEEAGYELTAALPGPPGTGTSAS
ncbi:heavy-metal-associated domain-containing protein [Streptomyces sp. NPDC051018]|uniref:heavy-metal-associated domain-containing protein n=1 Tax=Streptomyces sp. NPDC051018 TaxID=3365639 RepID=UPI0037BA1456